MIDLQENKEKEGNKKSPNTQQDDHNVEDSTSTVSDDDDDNNYNKNKLISFFWVLSKIKYPVKGEHYKFIQN
jgi:hypothetical protein